jgi:methyl-accepting chemotaxis protein
MRFTLSRVVHFYYVAVLIFITALFAFGVKHYWDSGLLNIDYVSNLYDGTSKVSAVKDRNDIDELKKFIDGDRIKDASKIFQRIESDIRDLKNIKTTEAIPGFDENMKNVRQSLINFQSNPELSLLLSNLSAKVAQFEAFVTEKKWPTLTKMSVNLRNRISPSRLMVGGLYNFERTQNLNQSVSNDLEAMTNFTESSGLQPDIKIAIINRIKVLKDEAAHLTTYIEEHKTFNRTYKDFSSQYIAWFKMVEPEIAFKKIQFEKSSQTIFYSIILVFTGLIGSIVLGFVLYNYSTKKGSQKTEKLVIDSIKENLLPVEAREVEKFSPEFTTEFNKLREYAHKRMTFGSIFQEAMPFASILLDSNLNVVWGNSHFYQQWQLQNFKEEDDSLTWDFLQRFTNLEDNSAVLSALRMSAHGSYKIQVKSTTMSKPTPFEMFVSPVDYSGQKRILVIFYPMMEVEQALQANKASIIAPVSKMLELQTEEKLTTDMRMQLRVQAEKAGAVELFTIVGQFVDKTESIRDDLNREIERLEAQVHDHRNTAADIRKTLVASYETQRESMDKYQQFKGSVSSVLDSRDQLEDQFKYALNSSRELFKDQNKILTSAEKAEKTVDDYIKSLKTITSLKGEFKELKSNVEEFKSRIVQVLDQLMIFQGHEVDTQRIDQFLGKIKIEMKGFDKVLQNFNEVVTMLDVTVTKVDMMVESREKPDLESIRSRMESIKNNLENVQFSASKLEQAAHSKDEEMITVLKVLVVNLKSEMKRINDMCKLTGMSTEHLAAITPETFVSSV